MKRPLYRADKALTVVLNCATRILLPRASWRRKWWQTRDRWHGRIWSGGAQPGLPRNIARHLPLYFTDPHWMSRREVEKVWRRAEPVEIATPPGGIRWTIVDSAVATTSSGSGINIRAEF
jgi:hypothetical protein